MIIAACLLAPVDAPVAVPFSSPSCDYCPGHRGVEFELVEGTLVRSSAGGVVTFVGVVAGTRYVVVRADDGMRATYGMLLSSAVSQGDHVDPSDVVGRSTARLYFGLRQGDTYVDPARWLAAVVRQPRLVPATGGPGRPARHGAPACQQG